MTGWRSRLRWRKPLEAQLAVPLWHEFVRSHAGDTEAAMGEVVAALMELGALHEDEIRW